MGLVTLLVTMLMMVLMMMLVMVSETTAQVPQSWIGHIYGHHGDVDIDHIDLDFDEGVGDVVGDNVDGVGDGVDDDLNGLNASIDTAAAVQWGGVDGTLWGRLKQKEINHLHLHYNHLHHQTCLKIIIMRPVCAA